jgi:hypothetical protein
VKQLNPVAVGDAQHVGAAINRAVHAV